MDVIQEMVSRGFTQLLGRASGPLHVRLVLMPTVVTLLAIRAGLRDARLGQPAFLWGILTDSGHRRQGIVTAWNDLTRVLIMAMLIDTVYQLVVLRAFYIVQALIVAVTFAIIPYILFRGPTARLSRALSGRTHETTSEQASRTPLSRPGNASEDLR